MSNQSAAIKVLLVEDNPGDARLIRETLGQAGSVQFVMEYADRLAAGLTRLAGGDIDVLLLDLGLPDSVGFETFAKAHAQAPDVPIIVLSSLQDETVAIRAVREGAQDYLGKGETDRRLLTRSIRYAIERKRQEQRLRLQAAALAAAANGIVITDNDGRIVWVNPAFIRLSGYTLDEVRGQNPRFLKSGRQDRAFYEQLWTTITSGQVWHGELINRRKDGTLFTEEMTITPVRDEHGKATHYVAIKQDITERQRNQELKQRSEQRYHTLAEAAHDDILIINRDGCLEYINNSGAERYGVPAAQMIGKRIAELFPPETVAQLAAIGKVFETGEPIYQEATLTLPRQKVWLGMWLVLLKGTAHEAEAVLVVARDITEQKRLAQQFQQAQKMEAVGQLAGGVAHDFNNLLTAILGYSELLLEEMSDDDQRRLGLEQIQRAGRSAELLTRQLLAFSRKQILEPVVLDLNAIVDSLDRMVRRLIGEDIKVITHLDPELGWVKADAGQIEQIIVNLAVNARDAMPEGGVLTIETANAELDEHFARTHPGAAPGRCVMLAVSDSGRGMDEQTQSHLFEPFFTTKERGKGTGLGLATVYGIVKQSGGTIWVYSEPGHGATFKIYLPREEGLAESLAPARSAGQPPTGTETVLLVEDHDGLRALALKVLERYGYTVLEAQDGDAALQIGEGYQGAIDLLLTDVVMPGMSGRALADRLAPLRPAMRQLFTSGYTDDAIVHHGVLAAGVAFLQKPYTPKALAHKVRDVLDAAK